MSVLQDEVPGGSPEDTLCDGAGPVGREEIRSALLLRGETAGIYLLDVRDRVTFANGHIRGAFCVPWKEIHKLLPLLPKGRCFVTYGLNAADSMSARAATEIAGRGFPSRPMVGGFEEWRTDGLPVHRGGVPPHQVRCSCFTAAAPPPSALRVG